MTNSLPTVSPILTDAQLQMVLTAQSKLTDSGYSELDAMRWAQEAVLATLHGRGLIDEQAEPARVKKATAKNSKKAPVAWRAVHKTSSKTHFISDSLAALNAMQNPFLTVTPLFE